MTNVNDAGTVTIDNTTPAQGDTLTAIASDADGATGAISYQWKRDGADIVGATGNTYTTVQADVGAVITVTVDYTDDLLTVESLTSAGTAAVTNVNDAGAVTIDNPIPAQGDMLAGECERCGRCCRGDQLPVETRRGGYRRSHRQHLHDCSSRCGHRHYGQRGLYRRSVHCWGSTSAGTAAVTNVNDAGAVTIDNATPAQGDTLTASVSDADGATGAIAYQWKRDGADSPVRPVTRTPRFKRTWAPSLRSPRIIPMTW